MPFATDLAAANAQPAGSFAQIKAFGQLWRVYVKFDANYGGADRATLVQAVTAALNPYGLTVNTGFQVYEPVVRRGGQGARYLALGAHFAGQADGGAESARQVLLWATNHQALAALSQRQQEFAVITHFAEVGRGFEASLADLYDRLNQIAMSPTAAAAAAGWHALAAQWTPATTYQQDHAAAGAYQPH